MGAEETSPRRPHFVATGKGEGAGAGNCDGENYCRQTIIKQPEGHNLKTFWRWERGIL